MRALRCGFAPAAVRCYTALPKLTKGDGGATLPELHFDWTKGVEPVFSPRQIELHYQKHHKAYVDKLNALTKDSKKYNGKPIEEIAVLAHEAKEQGLFNQAAQHFNHSFYWNCLVPKGKAMPDGLKSAIAKDFDSVEAFKKQFEEKGMANFGSGWTWLVYDPSSSKLKIHNTGNAGLPQVDKLRPIFTADVWEHAYYKDFENKRADYLHDLWQIVNWPFVAEQLELARK
jgi:Fe-Mn family superoxide dismutase